MSNRSAYDKVSNLSTLFKGLLLGSMIGAAVALVASPKDAPKTREELHERSIELRDKAQVMTEQSRLKAEELLQRSQTVYAEQKNRMESVVAGIKEGARTLVEPERGQTEAITEYNSPANPAVAFDMEEIASEIDEI